MKILIISGTPKKDGICHSLVEAAYETAVQCGADADVVRLADYIFTICKMCGDGWGMCYKEHRCVYGDDDGFNELQSKYRDANAYIYITPVYWAEVSEAMKGFLDRLRRCQATKQWDDKDDGGSFIVGKPNIFVASAGGGGGGIVNTFSELERIIGHMGGNTWPQGKWGIFDYIAVNRWNQSYKREALRAAVKTLIERYGQ